MLQNRLMFSGLEADVQDPALKRGSTPSLTIRLTPRSKDQIDLWVYDVNNRKTKNVTLKSGVVQRLCLMLSLKRFDAVKERLLEDLRQVFSNPGDYGNGYVIERGVRANPDYVPPASCFDRAPKPATLSMSDEQVADFIDKYRQTILQALQQVGEPKIDEPARTLVVEGPVNSRWYLAD